MDAMATAIRAARPDARPGDLFTPAVQVALRVRIARALCADVYDREAPLKVNGSFPRTPSLCSLASSKPCRDFRQSSSIESSAAIWCWSTCTPA
ncbi:MAG: hypothetical protein Q7R30_06600 [Acidobacteriota bacterium]|nr:hypothetical protein [Acidobacteriota bacterium]